MTTVICSFDELAEAILKFKMDFIGNQVGQNSLKRSHEQEEEDEESFRPRKKRKVVIVESEEEEEEEEDPICKIRRCKRKWAQNQPYPICRHHYNNSFQCLDCGTWFLRSCFRSYDGERCSRCFDAWQTKNGGAFPLNLTAHQIANRRENYWVTPQLSTV